MKLLIVEDKTDEIDAIKQGLTAIEGVDIDYVMSKESAVLKLEEVNYDLIILDLQIPPNDGSITPRVDHGMLVLETIQQKQPWATIFFFSAYGTISRVSDLLDANRKENLFADGKSYSMLRFFQKTELAECIDEIKGFIENYKTLDDSIEAVTFPDCLTEEQLRILKLFARGVSGDKISIELITGGMSAAKTVRVTVNGNDDSIKSIAVGKIGLTKKVKQELEGFERNINPVLPAGSFANHICSITVGAKNQGGNFFGLASNNQSSLYSLLEQNEEKACEVVKSLIQYESNWVANAPKRKATVGEIRRMLISDEKFESYTSLFDQELLKEGELKEVEVFCCPQHGDLHGFNVLVSEGGIPLLIDYGETRESIATLDPIILELSVWFHPDCAYLREKYSEKPEFKNWSDRAIYIKNYPFAKFVSTCRDWSSEASGNDPLGAFATAYAFCCKQLKYQDTDKSIAIDVAVSALTKCIEQE